MTADDIRQLRREPPTFRPVTVARIKALTPHLLRFTFAGPELRGLVIDEPAASVRLLMPSAGSDELVMVEWNGNEFLLPDGRRPLIRTFTPRSRREDEIDVDVVLHGDQGASGWASTATVGDPAAISGPGRGYTIDPNADPLLLAGDETAIPAIAQLLETVPGATRVIVHLEVARPDARLALPEHPWATVTWHDLAAGDPPGAALLDAISSEEFGPHARIWVAGEAAGVQRIRTHLADREIEKSRATVRGYWKVGRAGPG